jgi:poly(3-hydroxybutyrate) depolymerase
MLYELHEFQSAAFSPFTMWAQASIGLLSDPRNVLSYAPFSRNMAASYELLVRLSQPYPKPEFNLTDTTIDGNTIAVNEVIALDKPFCQLRHFKRATNRQDPIVLIVAPLSGHFATLLRDTVRAMLPHFDVYITDWVDAKTVPLSAGAFHLDDYVGYVRSFLSFLGPRVHVVSVCQPTVPVLAAISLMAEQNDPCLPASMTMMGGPIDTRKSPTAVNEFAKKHPISWFERKLIYPVPMKHPGAGRRVYPGFLQHVGFVSMNPGKHVNSHWDFYLNLVKGDGDSAEAHRRFYDEYNAVLDMPAEYYLETIKTVFHEHELARGKMKVRGQLVRPAAIKDVALLTIEGELDDITGSGQTEAAHELCANIPAEKRQHFTAKGAGHYGIFSGRRYREEVYPQIRDFIFRHGGNIL